MQQEGTMQNFSDEDDEDLSVTDLLSKAISTVNDTSNVSNGLLLIWGRSAGQYFFIYYSLLTIKISDICVTFL